MAITLTVEDGSGVTGANIHVDTTDVDLFCTNRNLTAWADVTEELKKAAILRAMDWIESRNFKGIKTNRDNPLKWPRYEVYSEDAYLLDSEVIPNNLKFAVDKAAYEESQSAGILQVNLTSDDFARRVKVGSIEVERSYSHYKTTFQQIESYLSDLVESGTQLVRC